ncbi:MAG: hypothetical protein OIN90_03920 [Candidatus Methanoperedens sp.]|uniref:hypothetical protein n=1 Tax=Candidatus Methanoperedens sp. BLZ2 TaxID=2035255 RepID=UPI000BE25423|nr:hypothetical protein [Candidatus Methanoperedens sp. BLZ2]KAB2940463.1 MAG: hypothetical protein F9K14_19375 [Candidatus Methanoperedens sp.]MBZ0174128.1 hypothetical protein [Candidatus Methanoperedens nitroreducens]MCX9079609.1 hypothetical protein [Candidatus Methanoperedens sp.]MCX9086691.1 hypothetical protein [Candidatus Methanoperedens sp.]
MDIDNILECLTKITIDDLHSTSHFDIRVTQRKNNLIQDANSIKLIILKDKPLGILKQDDKKFKLLYKLNDDYDLVVIISSSSNNPNLNSFNLVTYFIETSNKRKREE